MRALTSCCVVLQSALMAASAAGQSTPTAVAYAPPAVLADTIASFRLRLLGVFDTETGRALQGAEVLNVKTGVSALTNGSGLVRLLFLPDGGGLVRVQKVGYAPSTRFIAISPSDTAPVTELLAKAVPVLPVVTTRDSMVKYISPALRGFEQRRHQGFGHYISEAELRKKDDVSFRDVIAMFPGLMVSCVQRGTTRCHAVSTRLVSAQAFSSAPCAIAVYQDGIPLSNPDDSDLMRMHTYDYGGVEFYGGGSEIPPEYNATGNSCGVLLLWSRER